MSAIFYAIANVAESGDNIIVAKQVYGGTTTLTSHTIKRFGIEARYFNIENPEEINELADDKTKLICYLRVSQTEHRFSDFWIHWLRFADWIHFFYIGWLGYYLVATSPINFLVKTLIKEFSGDLVRIY